MYIYPYILIDCLVTFVILDLKHLKLFKQHAFRQESCFHFLLRGAIRCPKFGKYLLYNLTQYYDFILLMMRKP